jgi:hypothetical protein
MMGQKLPVIYEQVLSEAINGFGAVSVLKKDFEKARNLLKFLNLIAKIQVE